MSGVKQNQPLLSIIVVNYKTRDLLKNCLNSLRENPSRGSYEIIVVDNNSLDGSADLIRNEFPDCRLVSNNLNLGYAKGVNQGIKLSQGRYLLVLNADTVITPDSINQLLTFMDQNPESGICGPKLIYPNGELQYSCRSFYNLKILLWRRTFLGRLFPRSKIIRSHLRSDWDHNQTSPTDWLMGACLLVRRKAIEQVGMMDERYFLYFEDVDWCYRMHKHKWGVHYFPAAEVMHNYRRGSKAEQVINRDLFIHLGSMFRYLDKWNENIYRLKKIVSFFKGTFIGLLDIIVIVSAFITGYWIRAIVARHFSTPLLDISHYTNPLIVMIVIFVSVFCWRRLYRLDRSEKLVDMFFALVKGVAIAGLILLFILPGYRSGFLYSRFIYILFLIVVTILMFLFRILIRYFQKIAWRRQFNLKRVLVVGTGEQALLLAEEISASRNSGYEVAGFINLPHEEKRTISNPNPVLGTLSELESIIDREKIHEIFFVSPLFHYHHVAGEMIKSLEKRLEVRLVSPELSDSVLSFKAADFFSFPSWKYNHDFLYSFSHALKRTIETLISVIAMILLLPLWCAILIMVKSQTKDPLFSREKHIGIKGKSFWMLKLYTADCSSGILKSNLPDYADSWPNRTSTESGLNRLRKFLRRYNLEDLPQLINVIRGEMRVVGPRPLTLEEGKKLENWQKARFRVRPGITGLWQVDKERKWKIDEMVKLDLEYILNWSLLLDLKIILRTPFAILRQSLL